MAFPTIITATMTAAALVAACGGPVAPPSAVATPTALTTAAPSATPGDEMPSSVVVTFESADGKTWRVRLTDPADITIAQAHAAGIEAPKIPNGKIVRGSADVNVGWSWHLDADDFEWADMTIEVCDGNPGDVESGALTWDRYCPWSAKVVSVDVSE